MIRRYRVPLTDDRLRLYLFPTTAAPFKY